ncbi:MAG: hypothetical protein QF615_14440, partial [Planctomycetota bacterium]|nr:hypothetical protein [Planctomycetota bacterium]
MRNITNRRQARLPKHCHHKPSGRGYVRIPGFKMVYTGKWDTHEADAEYMRLIQEWLAADRQVPARWESAGDYDITDLLSEFMVWADGHYRREGGTTSREVDNLRLALRPLRIQFGTLPVGDFSPKKLKAYRQVMVEEGRLTRETVNQRVGIVKRLFAWAVSEEKCPPEVGYGLRTITHLRPERFGLRSQKRVQPVPREHVEAVLHYLVPTQADTLEGLCEVGPYPVPTSDIVALLVLEHQAHMHTVLCWARRALHFKQSLNRDLGLPEETHVRSTELRLKGAAEKVVDALLFIGEPRLPNTVGGDRP